jgi:hypothetical protein
MLGWNHFRRSNFWIKATNWEYWPFGVVQFPLFFYYPWLSLKAGALTFFSSSNPGITMGGMFGESKYDVLKLIPPSFVPKSVLIHHPVTAEELQHLLAEHRLTFPLIFKPDIGERGFMVKRINSPSDANAYLKRFKFSFIAQELVDLPLEFGVFYSRRPSEENGRVNSIVMKEMLYVEGNGRSTLQELILSKDRAKLQWKSLQEKYHDRLNEVIPPGMKMEIVSIGNHCLGTKFINASHLITDQLNASFDQISKSIPGFFFGRFDLRCASIDDLEKGNIKILELNGCGAEPAHIYDPSFSFWKAVGVLIEHWKTIYTIAEENRVRGIKHLPLREAVRHYNNFKDKTKVN